MHTRFARASALVATSLLAVSVAACSPPEKESDRRRRATPPPRPAPPTSAAWTRWSRRPRRRASSTSSRCRRTGPTTARSSRPSSAKYGIKVNSAQPDASQPGRDQRRQAAQGPGRRARRVRPRRARWRWPTRRCSRPYKVATWADIPAALKDAERHLGQRLRRLHVDRLRRRQGARADHASPTCSSPSTRARSRSTATRRRPAPRFNGVVMASLGNGGSADDIAPGRRLLQPAQEGRQLPAGRPDPGHHRVRPDPGRDRLGLPQRRAGRQAQGQDRLEDGRAGERGGRLLLRAGDQQGRAAPGGRPAVAGVPLLRRGPEPLAQGRRPAGPRRRHGEGRHDRQGRVRGAAEGRAARRCS